MAHANKRQEAKRNEKKRKKEKGVVEWDGTSRWGFRTVQVKAYATRRCIGRESEGTEGSGGEEGRREEGRRGGGEEGKRRKRVGEVRRGEGGVSGIASDNGRARRASGRGNRHGIVVERMKKDRNKTKMKRQPRRQRSRACEPLVRTKATSGLDRFSVDKAKPSEGGRGLGALRWSRQESCILLVRTWNLEHRGDSAGRRTTAAADVPRGAACVSGRPRRGAMGP